MFDHVEIKTVNFAECVAFYECVLAPLGVEMKWSGKSAAGFGPTAEPNTRFLIEASDVAQVCHLAFTATDEAAVQAFHAQGVAAGFECNREPGLRPDYAPNYYAAFLRDPDGNNIEAVVYV